MKNYREAPLLKLDDPSLREAAGTRRREIASTIEPARLTDALTLAALRVAMEALSGTAFVIRCNPVQLLFTNTRGKAMYESNIRETLADLARIQTDAPSCDALVARFRSGPDEHALIVIRPPRLDVDRMRQHATTLWRLTPREADVAGFLMQGVGNKDIANALKCSTKTIEKHVSAVLAKAHADSRNALLAMVVGLLQLAE